MKWLLIILIALACLVLIFGIVFLIVFLIALKNKKMSRSNAVSTLYRGKIPALFIYFSSKCIFKVLKSPASKLNGKPTFIIVEPVRIRLSSGI